MNKFIKTLIIINGIMFPVLFLILLIVNLNKDSPKPDHGTRGMIIGEEIDKASKANTEIQGLHYHSPKEILNTTTRYIPVSVSTYKEAMAIEDLISSSNNVNSSVMKITNILFMDSTYNEVHWLLDRKSFIHDYLIRGDYLYEEDKEQAAQYRHLLFEISFKDSNKDGVLNNQDESDLYISDLNGQNLEQITFDIDISHYRFTYPYHSISLEYTERNSAIKKEHRLLKFAKIDLPSKKFTPYKTLNQTLLEYRSNINKN